MSVKRTCTQFFYKTIANIFPGTKDNPGHRRHLARLLFSPNPQAIPIGIYQIARDYRAFHEIILHEFCALEYIQQFQDEVFRYEIIPHSVRDHLCRRANVVFPPYILELVKKELLDFNSPRCFIYNGVQVTKSNRYLLRKEEIEIANHLIRINPLIPMADKLVTYFNSIPPHRFNKVCERIPDALSAMHDKDKNGNFIISKSETRLDQLHILQLLKEQPQPIYGPSSQRNTVRLFEINRGLQNVHSYLRDILTQDWIEIDLQNAHLAIVAKLWNIPSIEEALSKGRSIWQILLPYLGLDPNNRDHKGDIKYLLYSSVYGMSLNNLNESAVSILGKDIAALFFKHSLMQDLLEARSRKLNELAKLNSYTSYLGKESIPKAYKEKGEFFCNYMSILSEEISEYEMSLIEPIVDLAMNSKQFAITLYQYDGVSIEVRDKSRTASVLKKIKKAVDERAKELDIHTTITVK